MKLKQFIPMALSASLLMTACCGSGNKSTAEKTNEEMITKHINFKATSDRMTPEALWAMGRLSGAQVSPDGNTILYSVSYYSVEQNKSNAEIYTISIDGTNNTCITNTPKGEYAPRWVKEGKKIAFMSAESGSMQLWEMNSDGSERTQISNKEGGIADYQYSPDNSLVLLIAEIDNKQSASNIYPDLDKTSGKILNDLNYKHWDQWVETIPHPFLYNYDGKTLSNERDLIAGETYECPIKPFGGAEQLAISPCNKYIVYSCKKLVGIEYARSTNTDLYLYSVDEGKTIANITQGMMGYDKYPIFSNNGTMIAWESMERDGYESDKNRIMVYNMETKAISDISSDFDQSSNGFQWDATDENLYFTSVQHGTSQIYKANITTKAITKITEGQHDYESIALAANKLVGVRKSMMVPNDIYTIDEATGVQTQITFENKHILDQLALGNVEGRWVETTDGKKMLVWVIYPSNFDANKKYPALLYCQGGPQSPVSQFWSYRWNFQMMAANDYIIVAPNRRGLLGFGQEWLEAISKDYGGQCMRDYFSAIDAVSKEAYVDTDHLGCVGASFGGYSAYWMAGNHNKRFKTFIAHNGMFNLEQQYLETEEMFFVDWDLGGPYWDKDNAATYAHSPHKHVDKWDSPILVIHSELDYRILAAQGMSAFNAAKLRGLEAQMLYFPDENHWVLQPQNGILWQRTFFSWLDKWLK